MTPQEEQDHYTYLKLKEKQAMASQGGDHMQPTLANMAKVFPGVAGFALEDTLKKAAVPAAIGVAGALGGVPAAGLAAGTYAIGKRLADLKRGIGAPIGTPFQEAKGPMIDAATAGLMQEPALLKNLTPKDMPGIGAMATPGVQKVIDLGGRVAQSVKNGLFKSGQTMAGPKADTFKQAYDQGLVKTYSAPNMEKAQNIFGNALGPEGQAALKESENAAEAFDPALSKARETAKKIGSMIEKGETVSAEQALQARQATDRIISSTPENDKMTRDVLYGWRNRFDNELSSQSGKLADASRTYRKAIVKDQLTNLTRMTKNGRPSAFLPLVLGAGGRGLEGIVNTLGLTSPLAWGLGVSSAGSAVRGLNKLADNPAIRQTLLQVLQRIKTKGPQK
jgi:hypothetical protein